MVAGDRGRGTSKEYEKKREAAQVRSASRVPLKEDGPSTSEKGRDMCAVSFDSPGGQEVSLK